MGRVDLAFENLRPVAADMNLDDRYPRIFMRREGRRLEFGHRFGWPHIGPDEAAPFTSWIGLDLHLLDEAALRRLRCHLDDVTLNVHLPAVIEATQSAFLVAAE